MASVALLHELLLELVRLRGELSVSEDAVFSKLRMPSRRLYLQVVTRQISDAGRWICHLAAAWAEPLPLAA